MAKKFLLLFFLLVARSVALLVPQSSSLGVGRRQQGRLPLKASLEVADVGVAALSSASELPTLLTAVGSNADIATLFSVATFGPQPFWLLMIALPNWGVTKSVMASW